MLIPFVALQNAPKQKVLDEETLPQGESQDTALDDTLVIYLMSS
jgi:hypothetical protein